MEALRFAAGFDGERIWAVGDCRHVSARLEAALIAAGERVIRVPAAMTSQTRKVSRQAGKSDPIDADCPQLLAQPGCGPATAAIIIGHTAGAQRFPTDGHFARHAGTAPVPASSGKIQRHRLHRGGDRELNRSIHIIALSRANTDPATRAYLARKQAEGKTKLEAIRCLKRHLARRIWHHAARCRGWASVRAVMLAVVSNFTKVRAARDDGAITVIDGAMGTELESRGVPMDNNAWCGLANLTHPELVQAIHEDHIRAGADVIITNTYMSGLGPMARAGLADRFEAGVRSAVRVAREAADRADRPVAVAGSASVTEWAVPPGDDPDSLRAGYARELDLLAEAGVDLIVLEMVLDTHRGRPALEAARATGLPVWLGLSTCTPGRTTNDAQLLPEIDETRKVATALVADDLDAVCVMHTDIDDVTPALEMLAPIWNGAVGVYPHRGRWLKPHWGFEDVDPDYLIGQAADWVTHGVSMIGGCCGLSTRHVQALRAAVDTRRLARR